MDIYVKMSRHQHKKQKLNLFVNLKSYLSVIFYFISLIMVILHVIKGGFSRFVNVGLRLWWNTKK